MNFAPIILFVFNRPEHTHKTIESLKKNIQAVESELFVFSDGPRNQDDEADVKAVRSLIDAIDGFKKITIHKRNTNCGLAGSVIAGVSEVIGEFGKAIVLEDDLLFSPHFLKYMNETLVRYEDDPKVFSIGGYSPPLEMPEVYTEDSYLSYRCCTWGWATWGDRWNKVDWDVKDFDSFINDNTLVELFNRGGDDMSQILKLQMDGKISSWGIRWDYAHFKNNMHCFRPTYAIVGNIGNDGTGIHCGATDKYDVPINLQASFVFPESGQLQLDDEVNRRFATFYDGRERSATSQITPVADKASFLKRLISFFCCQAPV